MTVNLLKSSKRSEVFSVCIFATSVTISLAISQGDTTLAPLWVHNSLVYVNYLLCLIMLIAIDWKHVEKSAISKVLLAVIILCLNTFNVPTGMPFSPSLLNFLLLFCFGLARTKVLMKAFKWYRFFLIGMCAMGILAYGDFILGLGFPFRVQPFYGSNDNAMYANYYLAYIYFYTSVDGLRLCGLYNEPGYLGTMIGLVLIVEKFKLRKGNVVMFVAGCLTMSAAFLTLCIVGLLLMNIRKKKFILLCTVMPFLFPISFSFLSNIDDPMLSGFVERFKYDNKTGKFQGDNREDTSFDKVEKKFDKSDHKLMGFGTNYLTKAGVTGTATYKKYIIEWGYLGFFFTFGFFFLIGYGEARKSYYAVVFLICFMLSAYQRPYIFSVNYYLIFLGGIAIIREASCLELTKINLRTNNRILT